MERRESFDDAADIYDKARPSYPDEVIDWIIDRTKISKDEKLLEIGSGTGQATIKFAEKGYSIHCIEMGKNLADILKQKGKPYNITVDVSPFERWQPQNLFKTSLVFSATAFHWIDNSVKYNKCYNLLKDNGYLVLLWNVAPEIKIEEVKKAYELLWEYYPEKRKETKGKVDIKNERKKEIIDSGFFVLEDYLDYNWKLTQKKDNFIKGFFTQSSYLALEEEKRKVLSAKVEELFRGLVDVIETDFNTTVYIAKKK